MHNEIFVQPLNLITKVAFWPLLNFFAENPLTVCRECYASLNAALSALLLTRAAIFIPALNLRPVLMRKKDQRKLRRRRLLFVCRYQEGKNVWAFKRKKFRAVSLKVWVSYAYFFLFHFWREKSGINLYNAIIREKLLLVLPQLKLSKSPVT